MSDRLRSKLFIAVIAVLGLIAIIMLFANPASATPNNDNDNPSVGSSHTPQNTKHPHPSESASSTPSVDVSTPAPQISEPVETTTPSQEPSEAPSSSETPSVVPTTQEPSPSATAAPTSDISVPANETIIPIPPQPAPRVVYTTWMAPMSCYKVVMEQSRQVNTTPYRWDGKAWVLDYAHSVLVVEYRTQMLEDWQVVKNCQTEEPSVPAVTPSSTTSVVPVVAPVAASTDVTVKHEATLASTGANDIKPIHWFFTILAILSGLGIIIIALVDRKKNVS